LCVCVCVCVQHSVFAVMFLIHMFIPDVPSDVTLAIKRVRLIHPRLYQLFTLYIRSGVTNCCIGLTATIGLSALQYPIADVRPMHQFVTYFLNKP